jgi:hypothetical protein
VSRKRTGRRRHSGMSRPAAAGLGPSGKFDPQKPNRPKRLRRVARLLRNAAQPKRPLVNPIATLGHPARPRKRRPR